MALGSRSNLVSDAVDVDGLTDCVVFVNAVVDCFALAIGFLNVSFLVVLRCFDVPTNRTKCA